MSYVSYMSTSQAKSDTQRWFSELKFSQTIGQEMTVISNRCPHLGFSLLLDFGVGQLSKPIYSNGGANTYFEA